MATSKPNTTFHHRSASRTSPRMSPRGTIVIKNLDNSIDSTALYDAYGLFGNILSCTIVHGYGILDCLGFVHFEAEEAADNAVTKTNEMMLNNKKIEVARCLFKQEKVGCTDLFTFVINDGDGQSAGPLVQQHGVNSVIEEQAMSTRPCSMQHQKQEDTSQQKGAGYVRFVSRKASRKKTLAKRKFHRKQTMEKNLEEQTCPSVFMTVTSPLFKSVGAVKIPLKEHLSEEIDTNVTPHEKKQMIGERIFSLVQELQPAISRKITGMLLELDNSDLLRMLKSDDFLKTKVDEAVQVLNNYRQAKRVVAQAVESQFDAFELASTSPQVQKQMIGEQIFPLVQEVQPRLAAKVTGMLLELDNSQLHKLMESREFLETKIAEIVEEVTDHAENAVTQAEASNLAPQPLSALQIVARRAKTNHWRESLSTGAEI